MLEAEHARRTDNPLWECISLGFGMIWTAHVAVRILSQVRSSTPTSRERSS